MKKFILTLTFLFTLATINAMTISEFVSKYDKDKDKDVEVVHLNKLALAEMSLSNKSLRNIDDIKVLNITNLSEDKKNDIKNNIVILKSQKDYDLNVKDDGSYVFLKMKDDKITEILVINFEEDSDECHIVTVKGDLKLDDANNINGFSDRK